MECMLTSIIASLKVDLQAKPWSLNFLTDIGFLNNIGKSGGNIIGKHMDICMVYHRVNSYS